MHEASCDAGKVLRTRIAPDADYWQLIPWFTDQENQACCGVASAVTVLNAMPIRKPVDPIYAPHAYFTQSNFFTPEVVKVISPQTVSNQGMTRGEMVKTLLQHGVKAMGDDGQFVLVNLLLRQPGGGFGRCWRPMMRNRIAR